MNGVFQYLSKVLIKNKCLKDHGLKLSCKGQSLLSNKFLHSNYSTRSNNFNFLFSPVCCGCLKTQRTGSVTSISFVRHKTKSSTRVKIKMSERQINEDYDTVEKLQQQTVSIGGADGWLTVGQYNVFAWSISGMETCVVIKSEDVLVTFDIGAAIYESIKAKDVFISHGHLDHIGALSSHVSKRSLFGWKPARYFVPPHLVDSLLTVTRAHYQMAETVEALSDVNILPFAEEDIVRLNSRYFVKCFPTKHRVPSQGYIVYREQKKLKDEFKGKKGFEIAALHREGKEIHEISISPEIAYTGDTTFEVFANPPTPDLLKVKLLITEATFIDNDIGTKNTVKKARDRGHCHLCEFTENAELFKDVGHIVLMHFSNKYSPQYIINCLMEKLPTALKDKVSPALVAKATKPSTFS